MPGLPLTLLDREEIGLALCLTPLVSWAELGRQVGRHATTVAREVRGHGGRHGYRPAVAHETAVVALRRPRACRLSLPGVLRDRVVAELTAGRSPYAIVADLAAEQHPGRPCVETLYTAVYSGVLGVKPSACLRSRRKRRRGRQARHQGKRAALPTIGDRPDPVNDRLEVGHWEADQIIGKANGSSMLWLTERLTRYAIPVTMPCGYSAAEVLAGLIVACEQIPAHMLRSITFDRGAEWADWETLAATYAIDVWFCDPHSPWQRGQIENQNRQFRWWFPRGTRLDNIAQSYADNTANILNNQRRRKFNGQSPSMMYNSHITVQ
jgi:transposase, IS30 family